MSAQPETLQFVLPMMRGDVVRGVQVRLAQRGVLPAEGVDGLFGPKTRAAVAAFQRSLRLPATGLVDPATHARLFAAEAPALVPAFARPIAAPAAARPIVPLEALPPARPARVVLHWTAGGPVASNLDRQHYHFIIEQGGMVVGGLNSIADNDSTSDGRYAAHTRGKNTGSVGIALCGMVHAREDPFHPGPAPIVPMQLDRMAALVAQICVRYRIPVTRQTVLAHGEVQEFLGVPQLGKWDPLVLPWRPKWSRREVGDHLRALVARAITGAEAEADPEARVLDITVAGTAIPGGAFSSDGVAWVRLDRLLPALGWTLAEVDGDDVTVQAGHERAVLRLGFAENGATPEAAQAGAVRVVGLAEQLDLSIAVAPDGSGVVLGGEPGGGVERVGDAAFRRITVARGDTLAAIAARELGSAAAWRSILALDATAFTEDLVLQLRPGEQVLVPDTVPDPPPAAPGLAADVNFVANVSAAIATETHPLNGEAARSAAPKLLSACLDLGVTDPAHLAYVLATAEHETNFGRDMVERWGPSALQTRYEGHRMNERNGDGERFRGRGYVQLTFRKNYRRFARALGERLEEEPDLAADPDVAARVMAVGMSRLGYRSPKLVLGAFGAGAAFDFVAARDIVNGDRRRVETRYGTTIGNGIARQARKYARILSEMLA